MAVQNTERRGTHPKRHPRTGFPNQGSMGGSQRQTPRRKDSTGSSSSQSLRTLRWLGKPSPAPVPLSGSVWWPSSKDSSGRKKNAPTIDISAGSRAEVLTPAGTCQKRTRIPRRALKARPPFGTKELPWREPSGINAAILYHLLFKTPFFQKS